MKVILLAGSTAEAADYAHAAMLATGEFFYVAKPQQVEGLRLADEDLIAEFYSFRNHQFCEEIRDALLTSVAEGKTKPKWARIGQ